MTSVVDLTKVGEKLGYSGDELRQFVKEEQAREREERHDRSEREKERLELEARKEKERSEREKERLELEARKEKERLELEARKEKERLELEKERLELEVRKEKERLELEKERLELEAKLNKDKLEMEAKVEREKFQMQLEMQANLEREKLEMMSRIERDKSEAEMRRIEAEHKFKLARDEKKRKDVKVKIKMFPFDEKTDQIDAYLNVYETYASAQDWDEELWSLNLPFLLKGTAREVFDRLPLEDRKDYDKLKEALLRHFELTDDGYKKKFRSERPREGETFVMFLARTARYLDSWLRLSKVEKSYEALLDFILRDQFLRVCSKELFQHLVSKKFTSSKDMAEDADLYAKARGGPKNVLSRSKSEKKEQSQHKKAA